MTPSFYSPGLPRRKHAVVTVAGFILERERGISETGGRSGTGPMGLVESGPCPHSILGGPTRLCPGSALLLPLVSQGLAIQEETGLLDNQLLQPLESWKRLKAEAQSLLCGLGASDLISLGSLSSSV